METSSARTCQINGRKYLLIGIMPQGFNYPVGVDMWTPLALSAQGWADRAKPILHVLAKLNPGVSIAQAAAEMKSLARELAIQFPQMNSTREISLLRLREEQYLYTAPMLLPLQVAAGFVLLLICANLANLMFARLLGRQREIAIRTALGANWGSLARAFLIENLLISILVGTLAITVSFWSVDLIRTAMPIGMTKWIAGWDGIQVDMPVLGFAVLLTFLLGLFFGPVSASMPPGTPPELHLTKDLRALPPAAAKSA